MFDETMNLPLRARLAENFTSYNKNAGSNPYCRGSSSFVFPATDQYLLQFNVVQAASDSVRPGYYVGVGGSGAFNSATGMTFPITNISNGDISGAGSFCVVYSATSGQTIRIALYTGFSGDTSSPGDNYVNLFIWGPL